MAFQILCIFISTKYELFFFCMRKPNDIFLLTKIIATTGPASESPEVLRKLINAGTRVFRINFSHGSEEDHKRVYRNIRAVSKSMGVHTAVMGDLPGPKIRIGEVAGGGLNLNVGDRVLFSKEKLVCIPEGDGSFVFGTNYPDFVKEVKEGQRVLLDDGNVSMVCLLVDPRKGILCEVIEGGFITSHKGVNLPDTELTVPVLTDKDYRCIDVAVDLGFDMLALSFVRAGEDVRILKDRLSDLNARPRVSWAYKNHEHSYNLTVEEMQGFIPVISKIEKPQAIDNLEDILEETDGVMIARGDLGVEMDLAEVAVHQKNIIRLCHSFNIPVIVATQMLQSMIDSPVPTRAEVSDVANAIFDGADAVMLSGETAVGKWPVDSVAMMNRIARKTNKYIRSLGFDAIMKGQLRDINVRRSAIAHGVRVMAKDVDAVLIVMWTHFGSEAVLLSQQRMTRPILAFSNRERTLRQMSLLYGLHPAFMELPESGSKFLNTLDHVLLDNGWAEKGEAVIIVLGEPIERIGIANRVVVHYVGIW